MSPTTPRPAVAADFVQPFAAWLRPIVFAALLARLATTVTFPLLYLALQPVLPGRVTIEITARGTLRGLVSIVPLALCLTWSTLFALAYRAWPSLRRHVETTVAMIAVGAGLGCIEWLINHFVLFRSGAQYLGLSLVTWLDAVAVFGPTIVWSVHRFRPLPGLRVADLVYAETSAAVPPERANGAARSRDRGYLEIFAACALIVPSMLVIHWLYTDQMAGQLMILWLFFLLGAGVGVAIGISFLLGGIWTLFGLRGRWLARLTPLLLVGIALLVFFGR